MVRICNCTLYTSKDAKHSRSCSHASFSGQIFANDLFRCAATMHRIQTLNAFVYSPAPLVNLVHRQTFADACMRTVNSTHHHLHYGCCIDAAHIHVLYTYTARNLAATFVPRAQLRNRTRTRCNDVFSCTMRRRCTRTYIVSAWLFLYRGGLAVFRARRKYRR